MLPVWVTRHTVCRMSATLSGRWKASHVPHGIDGNRNSECIAGPLRVTPGPPVPANPSLS